jgi:uncharacterized metal-binding protein
LRRFFEVVPVCCKVGGITLDDAVGEDRSAPGTGRRAVTCNPLAQAKVLERAGCDIAVLVGLCLGVDCVFTGATTLPVTTLFVKDRSLANNPIGALYSDYYLKEAIQSASERSEPALATGGASKDHTPDNGRTLK